MPEAHPGHGDTVLPSWFPVKTFVWVVEEHAEATIRAIDGLVRFFYCENGGFPGATTAATAMPTPLTRRHHVNSTLVGFALP